MATRIRSFAKINLGLAVGPVRPDGFHGLMTCYQTVALHDELLVEARMAPKTRVILDSEHPGVPCTARGDAERNTAYRIVEGALSRLGVAAEVRVQITKQLPVQGGLGAGSANAAAALLGLERELGRALPGAERLQLAAEIGSDVPLFLVGGAVLGTDRGQRVTPLPDGAPLPVVVAVPRVGVSTAEAFRDLDRQMVEGRSPEIAHNLTPVDPIDRLDQLSHVIASVWTPTGAEHGPTGIPFRAGSSDRGTADGDLAENPLLALVRTGVENDFEEVAFRQHPSLRDIKQALRGETSDLSGREGGGACYAALSGSGSALFGLYRTQAEAVEAQRRVQSLGVTALLTETLPRPGYWRQMFA